MKTAIYRLLRSVPASWRRRLKRIPGATRLRDRFYGMPRGPAPAPGELRPVVYLPTWLRWGHMSQRPQFMLEAFARAGHEVWVVDPTLETEREVGDRIRLVRSVTAVPRDHVILYTHFAPLVTLIDRFEGPAVIYDLMDDLKIYDADETGLPEERRVRHHHGGMTERADVFVVSNRVLGERHHNERPDLIRVENGVDVDRFSPSGPVAPVLGNRADIIGYHGAIAPWFDFEAMKRLARIAPDRAFVLVGPVDSKVKADLAQLSDLSNVSHIPEQPSDLIPDFVRGFSVGLVPFVIDEMTEGVTPLKMYEYMASGVPVVATPLPACVDHPGVATGDTAEALAEAIDRALKLSDEDRQKLLDYGRAASWDARIRPLLDRLEELDLLRVPGAA